MGSTVADLLRRGELISRFGFIVSNLNRTPGLKPNR